MGTIADDGGTAKPAVIELVIEYRRRAREIAQATDQPLTGPSGRFLSVVELMAEIRTATKGDPTAYTWAREAVWRETREALWGIND